MPNRDADNPEQARIPYDVAVRLPPAWDQPEFKRLIYSTFERFQICYACGNHRQAATLFTSLTRQTDAAERRRLVLVGQAAALLTQLGEGAGV